MAKTKSDDWKHLQSDLNNARVRTERSRDMIERSLKEVGGFRSIAVDGDGIIRAGNGVAEAAQKLGLKIRVVKAKGDEIIAVQRDDLKGAKAERAALYDNRAGELSIWDADVLRDLDVDLLDGIFEAVEIPAESLEFQDAPPTVQENIEELNKIREQRRSGDKKAGSKDDTERYLVIVFPNRESREAQLIAMGLPKDERYIPSGAIRMQATMKIKAHDEIAQPGKSSGSQGGATRQRKHRA